MRGSRILVLGGTGMLGSMLVDVLSRDPSLSISATGRRKNLVKEMKRKVPEVHWALLDVATVKDADLSAMVSDVDWIVNAIGVTNRQIDEADARKIELAIRINSQFPHILHRQAKKIGAHLINIGTDCVFSGSSGDYGETATQEPADVYGKTKSLGEVKGDSVTNLRTSFVGPEPKQSQFLMEWFLGCAPGGIVDGYTNHAWTGVTTLHFAKIVRGIVARGIELPNQHHLVPSNRITKADLLKAFAAAFDRSDIAIRKVETPVAVNRTLITTNIDLNRRLWAAAGYDESPSIEEMVAEISEFEYRFHRD